MDAGPYALLRHLNYVAVVGELLGMALLVGAAVTGPIAVLLFTPLLRQRIRIEDRALRLSPGTWAGRWWQVWTLVVESVARDIYWQFDG